VPPVAVMELEYPVFTAPAGRLALIVNAGGALELITSESVIDLVCAGVDESATLKVKLVLPLAVGVPEIVPVAGDRLRPAGSVPLVMDQA
jgi:hypothetical protein